MEAFAGTGTKGFSSKFPASTGVPVTEESFKGWRIRIFNHKKRTYSLYCAEDLYKSSAFRFARGRGRITASTALKT
jgi:hypothetical protein